MDMDIEDELEELKAELDRRNEDPKIVHFVNSREYRVLMGKQPTKVCELCGMEYKITHLCETKWDFVWADFWKLYAADETSRSNTTTNTTNLIEKKIELTQKVNAINPQNYSQNKKNNNCGACICIIVIIVIIFAIFW